MDELLALSAARAIGYLRERDQRSVFPDNAAVVGLDAFVESLPSTGTSADGVIALLDQIGGPGTVASTGGRYFGFVTGSAYPVAVGASWLSAAWDQNAAVGTMSPTAGVLDTVVGGWLLQLLGLPAHAQHQFVSGTSAANAACLAVGRDALLQAQGWDSVAQGLFGAPPPRIVVSSAAHSSVTKALGFVGLGRDRVVSVPSDDQGRMIASELPAPGEPTLVIAQAGNVNSGSMDPFGAIADHFEGTPHWIHVDGAFGLWASSSPKYAGLMNGIERADSWATDMHKWLNTTYDAAIAVVRDREDMARTFHVGASYIPDSPRIEPVSRGIDMSQRARAIEAWAVIKSLGAEGVAAHTERLCSFAADLAARLDAGGLSIVNDVVLNQILVRAGTDEETDALLSRIQNDETLWCGGSEWEGRPVIRISVCSWTTTADDIAAVAKTILGLAS